MEGILILVAVYAFTAIKGGASFWEQAMFPTVGIPKYAFIPEYIYNLPFNEWYMVQGGSVLVLNTIQSCVYHWDTALHPLTEGIALSMSSKSAEPAATSLAVPFLASSLSS